VGCCKVGATKLHTRCTKVACIAGVCNTLQCNKHCNTPAHRRRRPRRLKTGVVCVPQSLQSRPGIQAVIPSAICRPLRLGRQGVGSVRFALHRFLPAWNAFDFQGIEAGTNPLDALGVGVASPQTAAARLAFCQRGPLSFRRCFPKVTASTERACALRRNKPCITFSSAQALLRPTANQFVMKRWKTN